MTPKIDPTFNTNTYLVNDIALKSMQCPPSTYLRVGKRDPVYLNIAKTLHLNALIYRFFAGMDGYNLSYSLFRMLADFSNRSANDVHDWLDSWDGILIVGTQTIALVAFAVLASKFDNNDKNQHKLKNFIADIYPYVRKSLKATKNSYKGSRALFSAAQALKMVDARHLITPVGIILGGLAVLNSLWLSSKIEDRKVMMSTNAALLKELIQREGLTESEALVYLNGEAIARQDARLRARCLASTAFTGLVDGLYLYIGVVVMSSMAPPLLGLVATFSVFFVAACIVTRMYEEHEYQQKLVVIQARIELVIAHKVLENTLNEIELCVVKNSDITFLKNRLAKELRIFEKKRIALHHASHMTYSGALLVGLKYGLAVYGDVSTAMMAVSFALFLAGMTLPAPVVIVVVLAGLAIIMGFVLHSLMRHCKHLAKEATDDWYASGVLLGGLATLSKSPDVFDIKALGAIKNSLASHMLVGASEPSFWKEKAEVIRQFFSGLTKGDKGIDFLFNGLQKMNEHGEYKDTPFILVIGVISAFVFGVVFAVTAFVRGFGRPPVGGEVNLLKQLPPPPISNDLSKDNESKPAEEIRVSLEEPVKLTKRPTSEIKLAELNSQCFFYKSQKNAGSEFKAPLTPKTAGLVTGLSTQQPEIASALNLF